MPYIIAEPCIDVKDGACLDVCPVDCIYTTPEDNQMFIAPDECIDCAACEPVCPVLAIFVEDQTPSEWQSSIQLNYKYFEGKDDAALADLKEVTRDSPRNPNNVDISSLSSGH